MSATVRTGTRAVLAVGVVAAVCGAVVLLPGSLGTRPAAAAELAPFESCAALESWFAEMAATAGGPAGGGVMWSARDGAARAAGAPEAAAATGLDASAV
ncbi:MAG TPA: hypothetical protein VFR46_12330, partial [Actinomycetes bacterium]|nr:hypothetical protein [Actinomycetes bacterium]